jgi:hypothetical protein
VERQLHRALSLKDWLTLLGFDVVGGRLDAYAPPFKSEKWLHRFAFSRRAATAGGPSPEACTTCGPPSACSACRVLTPTWQRRERRNKALSPAREGLTTCGRGRAKGQAHRNRRPRGPILHAKRGCIHLTTGLQVTGGGLGALLQSAARKELFGGEAHTTNNRMELTAYPRAGVAQARPEVDLFTTRST